MQAAGSVDFRKSPEFVAMHKLSQGLFALVEQYKILNQKFAHNEHHFQTGFSKYLMAKSILLIRDEPVYSTLVREFEEKRAFMESEAEKLKAAIQAVVAGIKLLLTTLEDLANDLPEVKAGIIPLQFKAMNFELRFRPEVPTRAEAMRPAYVEYDAVVKVQDLFEDLTRLESEILTCAIAYPAEEIATAEQLARWGMARTTYADVLKANWLDPKYHEKEKRVGGEWHPHHREINSHVGEVVSEYATSPHFREHLKYQIFQALKNISQAHGTNVLLSHKEESASSGSIAEQMEALGPLAYDYGEGLLDTFFANILFARRQERTSVKLLEASDAFCQAGLDYCIMFYNCVSNAFHLVATMRENPYSTDVVEAQKVLGQNISALMILASLLQKQHSISQYHMNVLQFRFNQMKLVIEKVRSANPSGVALIIAEGTSSRFSPKFIRGRALTAGFDGAAGAGAGGAGAGAEDAGGEADVALTTRIGETTDALIARAMDLASSAYAVVRSITGLGAAAEVPVDAVVAALPPATTETAPSAAGGAGREVPGDGPMVEVHLDRPAEAAPAAAPPPADTGGGVIATMVGLGSTVMDAALRSQTVQTVWGSSAMLTARSAALALAAAAGVGTGPATESTTPGAAMPASGGAGSAVNVGIEAETDTAGAVSAEAPAPV